MADPAIVAGLLLAHCELMQVEGPTLPVAMPDVKFMPPPSGKYLRVDLFRNAPFWQGLTAGRMDQGLLQVTVVWPKLKGVIKPAEAAALVMTHFAKGTRLYGSGIRVSVNKEPWASSPLNEPTETLTPVTIPWIAS